MVLALIPATFAESEEELVYRLVIPGGETKDNMEVNSGTTCLCVPVSLTTEPEEEGGDLRAAVPPTDGLIFGVTFAITYDPDQLKYVGFETPDGSPITLSSVNGKEAGLVKCAFASTDGADPSNGLGLLHLFFEISNTVKTGDEIAFALAEKEDNFVEVDSAIQPVAQDLVADFEPYTMSERETMTGIVVLNEDEVEWKGTTPYVIWDSANPVCEPGFTVQDADGNVIDPAFYDYEYKENAQAGTAYIFVTFKGEYSGTCEGWFKIYLPASEWLTVENVADGIELNWAPVDGAAGYVIYRRAWNTTSDGWTTFERWWNVQGTTWTDGSDENHKVYAGTRYQYGVKAYFERRVDPIKNEEIGGNVNEPSGNYNLGIVSPLKTTVRITTRVLTGVTGGDKAITVNWERSKNFTGYDVELATDENFENVVATKKVDNWEHGGTVFTGLEAATTYYARVRSYHILEGTTYYGQWSNVLSAATK
jgi:hypothetical protein